MTQIPPRARGVLLLAAAGILVGLVGPGAAYVTPDADDAIEMGARCSGCHARGPSIAVSVAGPDRLPAGGTATYVVSITGGPGQFVLPYNSSNGSVDPTGYDQILQGGYGFGAILVNEEGLQVGNVTPRAHSAPSQDPTFTLELTAPMEEGPVRLRVAGASVNGDGMEAGDLWNSAEKEILIEPAPAYSQVPRVLAFVALGTTFLGMAGFKVYTAALRRREGAEDG